MTYYVCFAANYEFFRIPLEEMLRVEAESPQAAIEQVLRDGKWPSDHRLRCAQVVTSIDNRKSTSETFWLNFDGVASRISSSIFWP